MTEHNADSIPDLSDDREGHDAVSHGSEPRIESPKLAPDQTDGQRANPPRRDAPALGAPRRLTIMAPSRDGRDGGARADARRDHDWEDLVNAEPKTDGGEKTGHARMMAIAAMIAVGITLGAVGGSMATSGLGRLFTSDDTNKAGTVALEQHVARLEGELAALKADTERAGKTTSAARAKFNDRLDKLEKAQAEPNAKIARLTETVEKLRAAPPPPAPVVAAAPPPAAPAPVPVAAAAAPAKDVTGSISPAVPTPAQKPEVARLPMLDGWRIVDVAAGGATIEGRQGVFEVYPGDPVPGLGRVDAVRKQDGRWTVVTSRGLIVGH